MLLGLSIGGLWLGFLRWIGLCVNARLAIACVLFRLVVCRHWCYYLWLNFRQIFSIFQTFEPSFLSGCMQNFSDLNIWQGTFYFHPCIQLFLILKISSNGYFQFYRALPQIWPNSYFLFWDHRFLAVFSSIHFAFILLAI